MTHARRLVEERHQGAPILDFDIRGCLYGLALQVAPEARRGDLEELKHWIQPKPGETCVDIAAGTGFVTHALEDWVGPHGRIYAIDPSHEQLRILEAGSNGRSEIILGSSDSDLVMARIAEHSVDFVTSFAGIHHVPEQRKMVENVARLLKVGGRFVAADV